MIRWPKLGAVSPEFGVARTTSASRPEDGEENEVRTKVRRLRGLLPVDCIVVWRES